MRWHGESTKRLSRLNLEHAWSNYGPGATCGLLNLLNWPAEIQQIFIVCHKIAVFL